MLPEDRKYSKEHEWVKLEGGRGTVGITDYAQKALGDVVYVELPEVGKKLSSMEVFGTIESVKAVSELFCPVSGEVVEVNGTVVDKPELVNSDPYGKAWLLVVAIANEGDLSSLMTAAEYQKYLDQESKGGCPSSRSSSHSFPSPRDTSDPDPKTSPRCSRFSAIGTSSSWFPTPFPRTSVRRSRSSFPSPRPSMRSFRSFAPSLRKTG